MADVHYKINGDVAWVSSFEQAQLKARNGTKITPTNLATSVFQKRADGWNMVSHHGSGILQKPSQHRSAARTERHSHAPVLHLHSPGSSQAAAATVTDATAAVGVAVGAAAGAERRWRKRIGLCRQPDMCATHPDPLKLYHLIPACPVDDPKLPKCRPRFAHGVLSGAHDGRSLRFRYAHPMCDRAKLTRRRFA